MGKTYTGLLDVKPGDQFEIRLGHKEIEITPKEHMGSN